MIAIVESATWRPKACQVLEQPRSAHRYEKLNTGDEEPLTSAVIHFASEYGRFGYRRVHAMLLREGWTVNHRLHMLWACFRGRMMCFGRKYTEIGRSERAAGRGNRNMVMILRVSGEGQAV